MATYCNYHHNYQGHRIKNKETDIVTTATEPDEPLLFSVVILLHIKVMNVAKGRVLCDFETFGV